MKAILHIGMHKTGTSSIQASFTGHAPAGCAYFRQSGTNLNGWVRLMFEPDANARELPALRQANEAEVTANREKARRDVDSFLSEVTEDTVIFSAERMTYMSPEAVDAMRNWLIERFKQIEIYAYIREPIGFIRSSYQQRMKTLGFADSFDRDRPNYRSRFEKFESAFGADCMNYRLFRRSDLAGQNVVQDFAEWIGSSYDPANIETTNEGLSAEALAFLVAVRAGHRAKVDQPLHSLKIHGLVQKLLQHKGQSWSLTTTAQEREIKAIAADCDWMDERLASPLKRSETPKGMAISTPTDLQALAIDSFAEIRDHLLAGATTAPENRSSLLNDLYTLKQIKVAR